MSESTSSMHSHIFQSADAIVNERSHANVNILTHPDNSEPSISFSDVSFTEEEQEMIDTFSQAINIEDSRLVLRYGAAAQKQIASFSDSILARVRNSDLGDVGDILSNLIDGLYDFTPNTDGLVSKSAWRIKRIITSLRTKYSKVSQNVDRIVGTLEEHQLILMQDLSTLDELYAKNLNYLKEIAMYIIAGQKRLKEVRETKLVDLKEKAEATNAVEIIQQYKDLADICNRFEKKLHDLILSRAVALQMAPQVRLLQNNDTMLIDKIQSTIVNTIPLWKSQMVLALGLANAESAMRTQRAMNNATNAILKSNSQKLKDGTIAIAKESERGIVDLETVVETNKLLIETLTEVQEIQTTCREKRHAAEDELVLLEKELKTKWLGL